jgi:hypothetical protein
MSKIQKIAITDARLMQDDPAYAVVKGALSVSVAPFAAIAASSSQMTFQVLVPSLNVFIDRKIILATPLSFNANVFWGGARGASYRTVYVCVSTGTIATNINTFNTSKISTAGVALVTGATNTLGVAASNITAQIAAGQPPLVIGAGFAPGTVLTAFADAGTSDIATITFEPPTQAALAATAPFLIVAYTLFDVPEPQMSASFGAGISQGTDLGMSISYGGLPGGLSGWCSAVSGKDIALTQFPIQSCLNNMTATLNDCTVTTNGDTLREQLMLTSSRDTLKQRTTPTNADIFSWGRDDVQNGAGNFSTYSVSNGYGDIPNGAWPIAWSINASCATTLLATASTSVTTKGLGTAAIWPFLAAGTVSNFLPATAVAGNAALGGIGFYIAPVSTLVTVPTSPQYGASNVLVPFLNYQPVWTTGFPGGDLLGSLGSTQDLYVKNAANSFFVTSGATATLTLNVAVPPMSMVGARLYDALAGNYNTSVAPTASASANTSASGVIAIVSSLVSGGLGQPGSVYGLTYSTTSTVTITTVTGVSPASTNVLALSGGCPVGYPLPVYGTIACAEALVISPLIWADSAEFASVGLYGMTNMQFVLNFSALGSTYAGLNPSVVTSGTLSGNTSKALACLPLWIDDLTKQNPNTGNILRSSNVRSVISDVKYAAASGSSGPWAGGPGAAIATVSGTAPTLYATFLTPGVDVPLPEVSTVPYVEFPRYFYTTGQSLGTAAPTINSQTISLTSIPDMVMIYVKPNTRGPSQLDQYMPIKSLSVTFDNFSNLCSSYQQVNLYESAVAAGLDMDWHQWRGFTQAQWPSGVLPSTAATSLGTYNQQSPFTQLSGGPIILRMGTDITLQPGLAPGCLGNYSFQVNCTIDNSKGYYNYVSNPVITVIAINTGFFETMRGQSAIRKTILQMADVAAATSDTGMSKTHLTRLVGRGFSLSNLVNKGLSAVKKAKEINDAYGITNLARTYGGTTGASLADMADKGLSSGAAAHDSLYGHQTGKRHRGSGL